MAPQQVAAASRHRERERGERFVLAAWELRERLRATAMLHVRSTRSSRKTPTKRARCY
jgi:hypothetical protein